MTAEPASDGQLPAGEPAAVAPPPRALPGGGEHRRHVDRSGALWAALCFETWWRQIGSADAAQLAELGRPLRPSRIAPATGAPA